LRGNHEIISKLKELQPATPSNWRKEAQWRNDNSSWLRYSQAIAMIMLDRLEELDMTQTQLSESMGCSKQYVSKILKGSENLSLETISKIEKGLDINIIERLNTMMVNFRNLES
jgi:antitoxin component HigA of HigAB toxin-antitoxin module